MTERRWIVALQPNFAPMAWVTALFCLELNVLGAAGRTTGKTRSRELVNGGGRRVGKRRMERVEWRWIEEREGINYRLTHSIEGWSQTTCRGELENSDCRVAFQYWTPVAVIKTLSPRMCDPSTTVSLCAHPHGSESKRQRGIKIIVIVGLNSIHRLEFLSSPAQLTPLFCWAIISAAESSFGLEPPERMSKNAQSWLYLGIISLMTWLQTF